MDKTPEKYWFRAKQSGFGWGLPLTWQGWLVFIGYFLGLFLINRFSPPSPNDNTFMIGMALLGICWLKGEPRPK